MRKYSHLNKSKLITCWVVVDQEQYKNITVIIGTKNLFPLSFYPQAASTYHKILQISFAPLLFRLAFEFLPWIRAQSINDFFFQGRHSKLFLFYQFIS